MSRAWEKLLGAYDYAYPKSQIAVSPASPRDSAKLLVVKGESQAWTTFARIAEYLPADCVLVLNETKVIPARLPLTRSTGGVVAALVLGVTVNGHIRILSNRRLRRGEELRITKSKALHVVRSGGKEWLLKPDFPLAEFKHLLEKFGQTPLPPYIKRSPLREAERRREYQSVFARLPGSIAAPTASLHFTRRLLTALTRKGVRIAKVTLHVHLGTFAPLTEEQWKRKALHEEWYDIPRATVRLLERAHRDDRAIIAVGTTVVRALESAADRRGRIVRPTGTTRLFIREGFRFRLVSGLITNFHVPKSSLLMLVAGFVGRERLLALYNKAIAKKFRLFSFGDAMYVAPDQDRKIS